MSILLFNLKSIVATKLTPHAVDYYNNMNIIVGSLNLSFKLLELCPPWLAQSNNYLNV